MAWWHLRFARFYEETLHGSLDSRSNRLRRCHGMAPKKRWLLRLCVVVDEKACIQRRTEGVSADVTKNQNLTARFAGGRVRLCSNGLCQLGRFGPQGVPGAHGCAGGREGCVFGLLAASAIALKGHDGRGDEIAGEGPVRVLPLCMVSPHR